MSTLFRSMNPKSASFAWLVSVASLAVLFVCAAPQTLSALDWTARNGPEGGYVAQITVDRTDHNIIYLSNYAGLHRTTNGGNNWTNLNVYFGSSKILIDPANHNTLYIGNGNVIKSTDAGTNWTILDTKLPCGDGTNSLVIDPNNSSTLYAPVITKVGTTPDYYVIKSTDGGTSWTKLTWKAYALAIDPTNSSIFYASTTTGLQKSTDGGGTWSPAGTGLPAGQALGTPVIDPKTTTTLYVNVADTVYKSTNSGGQWQLANTGINGVNLTNPVVDPLTPSNVYAIATSDGLGILYKSTNGGGQWTAVDLGNSNFGAQVVEVDPTDSATLYTGTLANGVLKSTNAGTSWAAKNTGIKALVQHMALDASSKNTIFAGVFGQGVFQSTDGGNSWTAKNAGLQGLMVSALAMSQVGNRTLYVSIQNAEEQDLGGIKFSLPGIYKSTNGGSSWTLTTSPADNFGFIAPTKLVPDPVDPNGIYALAYTHIYHSTDAGATWDSSATGLPLGGGAVVYTLAVDPKTPATLYAGLYSGVSIPALIYKSTNSGLSWSPSGTGLPNTFGVYDLAVDPVTPANVYASLVASSTVNGGIYKSVNNGGSWQDTTSGLQQLIGNYSDPGFGHVHYAGSPLNCPFQFLISSFNMAIDPTTPSVLFAIVDGFVLRTSNAAGTWTIVQSGLPFSASQIGVSSADHTTVYAANQGIYIYTGTGGGGGGGGGGSSLTITAPNGGESWVAGSSHNITWTSTGTIANVKIEASFNGGTTYSTVVASTANTGSYSWTVPGAAASACKVRISDAAGTVSDTSNANFAITATSTCTYSLSASSRSFATSGGTGSVSVTAGSGCAWTAVSNVSWITVTSGASGTGNGTVNFTVAGTGATTSRTGTLTIGGQTFTVTESPTTGISTDLFIPIALSSSGVGGSFYTTETTFTNRGTSTALVDLTYTAAFGGGSGTATLSLPPGQTVVADEIAHLRSLGVPLPDSGSRGGTLRAHISNLTSSSAASVTVRTATEVRNSSGGLIGRAGLAYAAIPITSSSAPTLSGASTFDGQMNRANLTLSPAAASGALTSASYICGLRQNAADRSNAAFMNVGSASEGSITLRVTVFDGNSSFSQALPLVVLPPGGWFQQSAILSSNGLSLSNGYLKVERTAGTAPYYAYAVINDQINSDGSFVVPQPAGSAVVTGLTLPVIVQTSSFLSELVLANFSGQARTVNFSFVGDSVSTSDKTARFTISIPTGRQQIIPDIFAYMRANSVAGIGAAGTTLAGALFATATGGDISGVVLGARTSAPGTSVGGRFGLYYTAVPNGQASANSAWLFGLQQNSENRTNLAIVNTGETNSGDDTFVIDLYDGATGAKVKTLDPIVLKARGWIQIGTILVNAPGVSQGYAEIRRTSGSNPFIAYAVTNDGSGPGLRTGDGAYIGSSQ